MVDYMTSPSFDLVFFFHLTFNTSTTLLMGAESIS